MSCTTGPQNRPAKLQSSLATPGSSTSSDARRRASTIRNGCLVPIAILRLRTESASPGRSRATPSADARFRPVHAAQGYRAGLGDDATVIRKGAREDCRLAVQVTDNGYVLGQKTRSARKCADARCRLAGSGWRGNCDRKTIEVKSGGMNRYTRAGYERPHLRHHPQKIVECGEIVAASPRDVSANFPCPNVDRRQPARVLEDEVPTIEGAAVTRQVLTLDEWFPHEL